MVFNKTLDADGYMKFAAGSAAKVLVDSEDKRGKENPVLPLICINERLRRTIENDRPDRTTVERNSLCLAEF